MRRTLMGTLGILLLASGLGLFGPWAEAQPKPAGQPASPLSGPKSGSQTEVTVDVRQGKLGLGMPNPVLVGLDPATVTSNFTDVLRRDLEDAGPFALLKDKLPTTVEASTVKPWLDAGAEWVLAIKVTKIGEVVTVALQVLDVKATAQGEGKQLRYAFSKNYTGNASLLRRIAHTLVDDLVDRLTGDRGIANTRIIFVRRMAPGIKELFQVDRDGANPIEITRYGSLTLSPTVAPDGRLAYVTYKGGSPEIWGQKNPGSAHERLYPNSAAGTRGSCYAPVWSPDGRRLAFTQSDKRGNSDIIVLDMQTGRVRKLTDGGFINTEPSWNPAGTQIAFTSDREGGPQVYLMEADGSNVRRLTVEGSYNASPAWSPNGAMIAYVSRFEGKFDLFVFKLGEGKAYQVTTGLTSSESPAWSPDERRLVFSSNRGGSMQIWITDLSGNSVKRLTEFTYCQSAKWTRSR